MTALDTIGSPDVVDAILDIVAAEAQIDRDKLRPDTSLEELSIQSADYVMILLAIEDKFGVYMSVDGELTDAKTVGDLLKIVVGKVKASSGEASA